jgi:formylglycine-generating enzyme required for sulfatase activity
MPVLAADGTEHYTLKLTQAGTAKTYAWDKAVLAPPIDPPKGVAWNPTTDAYDTSGKGATNVHKNMKRCVVRDDKTVAYYLDPSDSTRKADGTAANLTGADGQVMVEIPAFYTKFTDGASRRWEISETAAAGFSLHPAFIVGGVTVAHRYIGAYQACVHNGTAYQSGLNWDENITRGQHWNPAAHKLSSVSGIYPAIGVSRDDIRKMAKNRGAGWWQLDFWLLNAVQVLFLVEYGTFNSQAALGAGNTALNYSAPPSGNQADSPHSVAGKSNSLGNGSTNATTGASSTAHGMAFVSYRGIENIFGNVWQWCDGFNINNHQVLVCSNPAQFADDTASNYTPLGVPIPSVDGFIASHQALANAFIIASVTGGSSTSFVCDQYYQQTGWRGAIVTGSASDGAGAGVFTLLAAYLSSYRANGVGGRLAG